MDLAQIALLSSQELDGCVAADVMGWIVKANADGRGDWYDKAGEFRHCLSNSFKGLRPFEPSRKIDHTWEVIDHLRSQGVGVVCWPDLRAWHAGIWREYDESDSSWGENYIDGKLAYVTTADTAQLAICRTALAHARAPRNNR